MVWPVEYDTNEGLIGLGIDRFPGSIAGQDGQHRALLERPQQDIPPGLPLIGQQRVEVLPIQHRILQPRLAGDEAHGTLEGQRFRGE